MKRFYINLIALISVILLNILANILPINGQTTGEISNRLNVFFTPAGYVFSIWAIIYALLLVWVLRQSLKWQRDRDVYRKTSALFVISCILNIIWIFMWHYEVFAGSVFIMIGLLATLTLLYLTIQRQDMTFFDRLPFSVYLGWVSVAMIANISYSLTYYYWSGWGISDILWTVILLLFAAALALHIRYHKNDWVYPLVFVWAFIGIGVKNEENASVIVFTAYVLSVVIMIGIFMLRRKQKKLNFSSRKLKF
ncbi:tryptophan-rich sensory protein [Jeotgalibacillus soli]|uniref:Membrane protein n=1 Tax=Jeotgalibacillus soli TaxID=889306 RepID=A0A0C2VWB0_9BACL|nr:tryptophan-rich sensory protein [Jeotgalibacillus soli]KIL48273.1 membrane protein [Jeotgalibacillus soli]